MSEISSANELINLFENYLKSDLKKHKTKIKEIKQQLQLIKQHKENKIELRALDTVSDLTANGIKNSTLNAKTENHSEYLDIPFDESLDEIDGNDERQSRPLELPLNLRSARQYFICTEDKESKFNIIYELFRDQEIKNSVIFCNSLENVENLTESMTAEGFDVENMIGKNAKQKQELIEEMNFDALIIVRRIKKLRNVPVYINFDLPTRDSYLKKNGSREKICAEYRVITLVTKPEINKLCSYEKYYKTQIQSFPHFRVHSLTDSREE